MRKGSRVHSNKKVTIPDEDEEEKLRRTEGKMVIIRAEFEKHKKEQMISVTEASKLNEVRLKNQLEELLTDNARKLDSLMRLENSEKNLAKQNVEDTQFYETISKFETSKVGNPYLSVAFHPNRTTTSMYGMNEDNRAEMLGDKMAQLMETLNNIELMIEEEEEIAHSIHEKYDELKKDQVLSKKKINELAKINDHADKRFADLERIEFLAHNKHAAAASDLKDFKEDFKELKAQESVYKKQKEEEKKRETEYLQSKQTEMSHIMIEIDKKRQELFHFQEEVKRLELKHEEMRDKRKNTRIVTKYIDTFNALTEKQTNLLLSFQALKAMADSPDVSRTSSPVAGHNPDGSPQRRDENKPNHIKRNSLVERNVYIEKIQRLYENHPEGPHKLADALIEQYLSQTYQEESLKSNYEELQNNKKMQENELLAFEEELKVFKKKNEYITLGKSGSKILDSNEQEAIDSGMLIVASQPTTLNQAKFDFENKKEADNDTNLFVETEAFVLRCYMDSIEMISRFSKILMSINQQSAGGLSDEMKELSRLTHIQTAILKKSKKFRPEMSVSHIGSEVFPETRNPTDNSAVSERDKEAAQDQIMTLDLNEVQEAFIAAFEDENERAAEFVETINHDVMIISFISIEDIKNYLESCKLDPFVDQNIQRVFERTNHLRKTAIENMLQKFETIYKVYSDIITTTQKNTGYVVSYLKEEGVKIPKQDMQDKDLSEPNEYMKKALEKKWKRLLDRYDYDPARDFRKTTQETETSDHDITENLKEKLEEADNPKEEIWDKDDTKAKLNEIVDSRSRKAISKTKNEEEKKRLQAKKEKERQRLELENMSDDAYLDWQRNRIRNEGKDDTMSNELNEHELLRKAQAELASRLSSSTAPMAELKRMIQNSKVLAKIQILERQKCLTDGKRNLNYAPVDNYIPPEPVKVPRSPQSANQSFNPRMSRNFYTPSTKPAGSRFFATSSDRFTESEYAETPKDMTSKSVFQKSSSKFKPIDAKFDFTSVPTQENEKPQTQIGGRRLRTLNNFQAVPSIFSSPVVTPGERYESKPKKLQKNDRNASVTKNKYEKSVLPKLEKNKKKKSRANKKDKKNRSMTSTDHDNIDHLLRIQTDPLLKMVYSPTFFAQSLQNSTYYTEDMGYRFDSFKFSTPGLLISEKVLH